MKILKKITSFVFITVLAGTMIFSNVFASDDSAAYLKKSIYQEAYVIIFPDDTAGSYAIVTPYTLDSNQEVITEETSTSDVEVQQGGVTRVQHDTVSRSRSFDLFAIANVKAIIKISGNVKSIDGSNWVFDGNPQHSATSMNSGTSVQSKSITGGGSGYSYVDLKYSLYNTTNNSGVPIEYHYNIFD